MKALLLSLILSTSAFAMLDNDKSIDRTQIVKGHIKSDGTPVRPYIRTIKRDPSSVDMKRLIEIDERSGCCSHHGGVSHCSGGTLYCSDGWVSGCGC